VVEPTSILVRTLYCFCWRISAQMQFINWWYRCS